MNCFLPPLNAPVWKERLALLLRSLPGLDSSDSAQFNFGRASKASSMHSPPVRQIEVKPLLRLRLDRLDSCKGFEGDFADVLVARGLVDPPIVRERVRAFVSARIEALGAA